MQHIIKTCLKLQYLVLFCLYTKNAFFLISFYFFIFFLGGGRGILIIEYTPALQENMLMNNKFSMFEII